MSRSGASRGASSASSLAAASGTASPERSTPPAVMPGRMCVSWALAGAAGAGVGSGERERSEQGKDDQAPHRTDEGSDAPRDRAQRMLRGADTLSGGAWLLASGGDQSSAPPSNVGPAPS